MRASFEAGRKIIRHGLFIENGSHSANWGLQFKHLLDEIAFTTDPSVPEAAVAYPTEWLLKNLRSAKLELAQPIRYGSWPGRQPAYSGQDVLILEKRT